MKVDGNETRLVVHAQYGLQCAGYKKEVFQNVPRVNCCFLSLVHQERDLSFDCVRGPVSTAASAGDSEVTHSSPVSQIPDS